jgi:hypothetical protein
MSDFLSSSAVSQRDVAAREVGDAPVTYASVCVFVFSIFQRISLENLINAALGAGAR